MGDQDVVVAGRLKMAVKKARKHIKDMGSLFDLQIVGVCADGPGFSFWLPSEENPTVGYSVYLKMGWDMKLCVASCTCTQISMEMLGAPTVRDVRVCEHILACGLWLVEGPAELGALVYTDVDPCLYWVGDKPPMYKGHIINNDQAVKRAMGKRKFDHRVLIKGFASRTLVPGILCTKCSKKLQVDTNGVIACSCGIPQSGHLFLSQDRLVSSAVAARLLKQRKGVHAFTIVS